MRTIRSIVGAAIAGALVACGATTPIDGEPAPIPDGPVRFENVILADDRLSVRVDFIGGREFAPDEPCSIAYEGTTEIVGEELEIGIYAIQHPMPLAPDQGCDAMGHSRTLTLPLEEPFEGTVVRDVAGQVLFLAPPPGLALVGALPDGWDLRREGNVLGGSTPRWERVWSPDPDPWPAQGASMLTMLQAFGGPVEATGADPRTSVQVNGQEAAFWFHAPSGEMVVVWSLGDDELALVGYLGDFTRAEFIGLAESVTLEADASRYPLAAAEPSVDAVQLVTCEHATGAYRVQVPDGWWTNPAFEDEELGSISACRFFGPAEFDVTTGDREDPIPEGVAIWIDFLDGGCVGFINPTLSSRTTMIDAYPAVVTELAEGKLETNPAFTYQYVVTLVPDMACEEGGRYIYALTRRDFPGDYETNKHVLDEVMESLEIREP